MACDAIKISSHWRCFCNGKLAKNSRCKLPKRSTTRTSYARGKCVPGTVKYIKGGACACKTKGGGFKTISKGACKRKYAKK